jgi:hypothetical protein
MALPWMMRQHTLAIDARRVRMGAMPAETDGPSIDFRGERSAHASMAEAPREAGQPGTRRQHAGVHGVRAAPLRLESQGTDQRLDLQIVMVNFGTVCESSGVCTSRQDGGRFFIPLPSGRRLGEGTSRVAWQRSSWVSPRKREQQPRLGGRICRNFPWRGPWEYEPKGHVARRSPGVFSRLCEGRHSSVS